MEKDNQDCPICKKQFAASSIEVHVNKCIFLNSAEDQCKRKRSVSPILNREMSQSFTSPKNELKGKKYPRTTQSDCTNTSHTNAQSKIDPDFTFAIPLATLVQPKFLQDFFGQSHILGKETVLRMLLEKSQVPNMILWGPPGCGKTSLANIVHEICKKNPTQYRFVGMCAANCGVKEVQSIIATAKNELAFGRKTILFMDEIHRFNKRQQDIFLAHVEKGDIILLGATTENPSFSINNALLSRCRVIVMEKLETDDMILILKKAIKAFNITLIGKEEVLTKETPVEGIKIEQSAIEWLADISDGDARIALTNLQLVLQHNSKENVIITIGDVKEGIKKSHLLYDRKGEEHYNIISAMHKSIRGSDANAALYWTTRMIVSGEDPLFIARRLVRAASEDIGNADPNALQLAVSTMQGCQLIGMPEADVLLAQCAIYLARAPKSREADSALAAAKSVITNCQGPQPSVPMHIRNAPTKLMKDLGYGKLAKNARNSFMPKGLEDFNFFLKCCQ